MSNNTAEVMITRITPVPVCAVYPLQISTYIDVTISIFTIIIGITSWVIIKKFRRFNNYILLSIILNNTMNAALGNMNWECIIKNRNMFSNILYFLLNYFSVTSRYWLLVLCYKFYLDLVKIYNSHITKRYLKANLFAWGLPLLLVTLNDVILPLTVQYSSTYVYPLGVTYMLIPLVMNVILYLIIVYNLFIIHFDKINVCNSKMSIYRSLLLLTVLLSFVVMQSYGINMSMLMKFGPIQDLITIIYFLTVDQNMSNWRDYFKKCSNVNKDHKSLPTIYQV